MKLEFMILCDFAQVYEGKLVAIGAFDRITLQAIKDPAVFWIGFRVRASAENELGKPTAFTFSVTDGQGKQVFKAEGSVNLARTPDSGAMPIDTVTGSVALRASLNVPSPGKYFVAVSIANEPPIVTPLWITVAK